MNIGAGGTSIAAIIVGALVAAVSGYLAIRFMLELISKKKMYGFAIYVLILGVFVIVCQFCGVLFEPMFA